MKRTCCVFFLFLIFLTGCDYKKREQALKQKESELNKREEELVLREKALQLQEEEFKKKKSGFDSLTSKVLKDTGTYNADLVGNWDVKMNCIETNCPGSAIGDTKTEQWQILYDQNKVVANAIVNQRIVRTYVGTHSNNIIELEVQPADSLSQPIAKIQVHLQLKSNNYIEGRREITQQENCRIVYSLTMNKK